MDGPEGFRLARHIRDVYYLSTHRHVLRLLGLVAQFARDPRNVAQDQSLFADFRPSV